MTNGKTEAKYMAAAIMVGFMIAGGDSIVDWIMKLIGY